MGLLTAGTLLFFFAFERSIVTVAYDPDFACTQGLATRAFETALTLITALTIVGCLRMVASSWSFRSSPCRNSPQDSSCAVFAA